MADPTEVILYTDGACRGNPGRGGWAYILKHVASGRTRKAAEGEPQTTNNRMELTAVLRGLQALTKPCKVVLVTDSEYVAKGIKEWMPGWKRRGWRRSDNGAVANADLWQDLDKACAVHRMTFQVVKGHSGHPENEECDRLATEAADRLV